MNRGFPLDLCRHAGQQVGGVGGGKCQTLSASVDVAEFVAPGRRLRLDNEVGVSSQVLL